MDKNEYINRSAALQSSEILSVNTKEYGKIDVVPVGYLQDLPVMTFPEEDDFFNRRTDNRQKHYTGKLHKDSMKRP